MLLEKKSKLIHKLVCFYIHVYYYTMVCYYAMLYVFYVGIPYMKVYTHIWFQEKKELEKATLKLEEVANTSGLRSNKEKRI